MKPKHGGPRKNAGRPKLAKSGRSISFYSSGSTSDCIQLLMLRWHVSVSVAVSRAIVAAAALERGRHNKINFSHCYFL